MATAKICINTVEQWNELYADDPFAVSLAQQMSQGNMAYEVATLGYDNLYFEWGYFGAKVRRRDVSNNSASLIGYSYQAPQTSKVCGEELDHGDVYVIQPGVETDHISAKKSQEFWFALSPESAAQMCIVPSHDLVKRVNKMQLQKLTTTCQKAMRQSGDWQSQILADLYDVLEPWRTEASVRWRSTTAGRHFNLFRQAEKLLPDATSGETAEIDRIADQLGVSRRLIFQTFQSSIGMSPAKYQRLRQLHALRDLLHKTKRGARTVTELASSSGFSHLGRMYVDYRNHFGETPLSTLQR